MEIVYFLLPLLIFDARNPKYLWLLGRVIFCQNGVPSEEQPSNFIITSKTNELFNILFLLQNLLLGLVCTGRYKTIGLTISPKSFLKPSVLEVF